MVFIYVMYMTRKDSKAYRVGGSMTRLGADTGGISEFLTATTTCGIVVLPTAGYTDARRPDSPALAFLPRGHFAAPTLLHRYVIARAGHVLLLE